MDDRIFITYEGKLNILFLNDILFCESLCHNSEIYFHAFKPLFNPNAANTQKLPLPKQENLFYLDTIKPLIAPIGIHNLALLLPGDSFCKIHRKYIVYLGIFKDATIEADKILFGGYILRISREYADEFLDKLKKFHFPAKPEWAY